MADIQVIPGEPVLQNVIKLFRFYLFICLFLFTFQPGPEPWRQCQEFHSPCTSYRLFLCTGWLLASSFAPVSGKIEQDDECLCLDGTYPAARETVRGLTFIIMPACSIALWIWRIASANHVGFIFLVLGVMAVVKRKHLLSSMEKPVSFVKEIEKKTAVKFHDS